MIPGSCRSGTKVRLGAGVLGCAGALCWDAGVLECLGAWCWDTGVLGYLGAGICFVMLLIWHVSGVSPEIITFFYSVASGNCTLGDLGVDIWFLLLPGQRLSCCVEHWAESWL